jgi:phage-related minor tail protein
MEDAFVSFVQTGKLDFSSLIDSMIADLVRLFVRSQILGPIAQALGGFDLGSLFGGGAGTYSAMQGIGGWGGRAAGGSVKAGRMYRVGEMGMEYFMPGVDGTIVPHGRGVSTGGEVNVVVHNYAPNSKATATTKDDGRGGKSIEVVIDEISGKNLARHGSASDRALRSRYNLSPALTWR